MSSNILTILEHSFEFTPPASLVDIIDDTSPANSPIAFGCYAGHCAACMVTIESGSEHLSEITQFERYTLSNQELTSHIRLACQLTVVSEGEIVMRPTYS